MKNNTSTKSEFEGKYYWQVSWFVYFDRENINFLRKYQLDPMATDTFSTCKKTNSER